MEEKSKKEDINPRKAYESRDVGTYSPENICISIKGDPTSYADRLLADKMGLVSSYYFGGRVLDLCSAVGQHLFDLAPEIEDGIGLDFSRRYIETAAQKSKELNLPHIRFVHGDAQELPFADESFSLVYSLSSLYQVPDINRVVSEIARILLPGGVVILDLGNLRSLNTYCLKFYTDWPRIYPVTPGEMKQHLAGARLDIVEHRCFQILPLWAGLPKHLWPLLHPRWQDIMRRRVAGRMIDEWVSSLPVVRNFAFRHLIVCRKAAS